jgi:hypothetical protein
MAGGESIAVTLSACGETVLHALTADRVPWPNLFPARA